MPERRRDLLVALLTLTTGAVDAAAFLHLGHVFGSVVTGTMVLLGVAAGTHDSALAVSCGVGLAAYICGVLIGAPIAVRSRAGRSVGPQAMWPPSVTAALAVEFCTLAAFCVGWELQGGRPSGVGQLVVLGFVAASMGIQSASVRQLGELSTTYLTGTLTGVVASLTAWRKPEGLSRSLAIFAALITGALVSAVVTAHAPSWLPALVLLPLAVVLALSRARPGALPGLRRGAGP
jgi:uncharacterized membrane protein YoaK (UPF0700 family)